MFNPNRLPRPELPSLAICAGLPKAPTVSSETVVIVLRDLHARALENNLPRLLCEFGRRRIEPFFRRFDGLFGPEPIVFSDSGMMSGDEARREFMLFFCRELRHLPGRLEYLQAWDPGRMGLIPYLDRMLGWSIQNAGEKYARAVRASGNVVIDGLDFDDDGRSRSSLPAQVIRERLSAAPGAVFRDAEEREALRERIADYRVALLKLLSRKDVPASKKLAARSALAKLEFKAGIERKASETRAWVDVEQRELLRVSESTPPLVSCRAVHRRKKSPAPVENLNLFEEVAI